VNRNVTFFYNSTLEGSRSVLILTCENLRSTDKQILSVLCHSSENWIPNNLLIQILQLYTLSLQK
jgi:hypothetical protein